MLPINIKKGNHPRSGFMYLLAWKALPKRFSVKFINFAFILIIIPIFISHPSEALDALEPGASVRDNMVYITGVVLC